MKRVTTFLAECWSSVQPGIDLMRLPIARYKLATLNPLCPADQMLELMLEINRMEKS